MTGLVVGVDLGKCSCRAAVHVNGFQALGSATGPGFSGLAEPDGAVTTFATITATLSSALAELRRSHPAYEVTPVDRLFVGAAGADASPAATAQVAQLLAQQWGALTVGVASDSLTGHAGALSGSPGVVLTAGTGAVALGVSATGSLHRVDGWGQWLGDEGSGAWIGREALRCAVRAHDGRGPATSLLPAAERRYGTLRQLPSVLSLDGRLPRATAGFVPDVIDSARSGDREALRVLTRAARHWVESTVTAARAVSETTVAVIGGLAGVPLLREAWAATLPADLSVHERPGSALDGSLLLASRTDLPHERFLHRHENRGAA